MMSILGRRSEQQLGCGFLSQRDADALVEGRLPDDRLARFREHVQRCAECLHLHSAATSFRELLDKGALDAEMLQFAGTARLLRARLRQEIERIARSEGTAGLSGAWGLSASELEGIAAAGPPMATNDEDSQSTGPDDETDAEQ